MQASNAKLWGHLAFYYPTIAPLNIRNRFAKGACGRYIPHPFLMVVMLLLLHLCNVLQVSLLQ
jgi:hypothetical protein